MKRIYGFKGNVLHWTVVIALLFIFGCAGSYGRIQRESHVTQAFQQMRLPQDHTYYYIGRSTMPYAIVGIQKGYKMRTKYWKPVQTDTDEFRKMVANPYSIVQDPAYGARILDPAGNPVGIWYSTYNWTTVEVTEDKEVIVYNPYKPDSQFSPTAW